MVELYHEIERKEGISGLRGAARLRAAPRTGRSLGRRLVARRRLDDLEVGPLELAQLVVEDREARVGRDRNGPLDAVVGDEHAVLFESLQDRLDLGREAGNIDVLAQPQPLAHA